MAFGGWIADISNSNPGKCRVWNQRLARAFLETAAGWVFASTGQLAAIARFLRFTAWLAANAGGSVVKEFFTAAANGNLSEILTGSQNPTY
jgi:hypothetical protein